MREIVVLTIILGPAIIVGLVGYLAIIRPMQREARGWDAITKTMSKMPPEDRRLLARLLKRDS
jgi:hypothetical protein